MTNQSIAASGVFRVWAHVGAAGLVVDVETLPAAWVPGKDIHHADIAAAMVDVTGLVPQPAKGWIYAAGAFSAPAAVAPPKDALDIEASNAAAAVLATPRTFTLTVPGREAVAVLCDGTDKTMIDLGALWRFGVLSGTAEREWVDDGGGKTMLTGSQFVALETAVSSWRSAVVAALADLKAKIAAGSVTTFAAVTAVTWPMPAV